MRSEISINENILTVKVCNPCDMQEISEIIPVIEERINGFSSKLNILIDLGEGIRISNDIIPMLRDFVEKNISKIGKYAFVIIDKEYFEVAQIALKKNGIDPLCIFINMQEAISYLQS